MKLKLTNVRLSFADLYNAVSKFDGDPKYSASFIIDPATEDGKANLAEFKKIVRQHETEKFEGAELPTDKLPIQDGNDKGYDGWVDIDAPYAGCIVNAVLDVWPMNNQYGKRIIASLEAVQFAAKGAPFSASSVDVTSDFEVISESDIKDAFSL